MATSSKAARYIFSTVEIEGGFSTLAYRHSEYVVVITDRQQIEVTYTSPIGEKSCAAIWKLLLDHELIRVEQEPESAPIKDIRPFADMLINRKPLNETLHRLREQTKADKIARIKALADRLKTEPVVLVSSNEDHSLFSEAKMKCLKTHQFRQAAQKVNEIHTKISNGKLKGVLGVLGFLLGFFVAAFFLYCVLTELTNSQESSLLNSAAVKLLEMPDQTLVIACGAIGLLLYVWRCRWLFTYGCAEVFFGALGVYYKVIQMHARLNPEGWVGVVLAVYIIVRGLDNMGKAPDQPKWMRKPWNLVFGTKEV
jgi:hypothetical protein